MLVYRTTKKQYAHDLSGGGAMQVGGRWNSPGIPMVYTSERLSCSMLEALCYTTVALMAEIFSNSTIEIPDDIKISRVDIVDLPDDWRNVPSPESLRFLGNKWAKSFESAVLSVPSVLSPNEKNFIINPLHPDSEKIKILAIDPVKIDKRIVENALRAYHESKV